MPRIAEVLRRLGSHRALVVHARDGLDEISIGASTLVAELRGEKITEYEIDPAEFGIDRTPASVLKVGNATESLARIRDVFAGQQGPARQIVALNAGAALYVCDLVPDIRAGYARAQEILDTGAARDCFERYVSFTRQFGAPTAA